MYFATVVSVKDFVLELYFAYEYRIQKYKYIGIHNTTHMSIELNIYKYIECIYQISPSHDVNAEAEIFRISWRLLLQFIIHFRRDIRDDSSLH